MNIVISSGHGALVQGAVGYLNEVDEARRVVDRVAEHLKAAGVGAHVFHDNESTTQNENLNRIVDYHNSKNRELDVSVHFNAYQPTQGPMGCECLYVTQEARAKMMADAICAASGLKNRGPKLRNDLFFLNNTNEAAILIETCFVDSQADEKIYKDHFNAICVAIAEVISGADIEVPATPPPAVTEPPATEGDVVIPVVTVVVDPPGSVKIKVES